jgi:acyl-CoA thioesterase
MESSGNDAAAGLRLVRFFEKDRFAAENGMRVVEVRIGYARTEMETCPRHLNAIGIVQGGAVFTLADLAFAACSNSHGVVAVACQVDITYFQAVREGRLMATAEEIARTHKLSTCLIRVTAEDGRLVALFKGVAYIKGTPIPFDGPVTEPLS